jgi:phosphatidylserine/phosphatidylglycerophosphate/cardiolipin synthase-like enzyme
MILGDEPTEFELRKYLVEVAWTLVDVPFEYRRLPSSSFHDKYFMIDGVLGGTASRWVWTGSHNFSRSSLRTNEETALTIESGDFDGDGLADNTIYEDFLAHFEWQWARAAAIGAFPME